MLSHVFVPAARSTRLLPVVPRVLKITHSLAPVIQNRTTICSSRAAAFITSRSAVIIDRPVLITMGLALGLITYTTHTIAKCMEANFSFDNSEGDDELLVSEDNEIYQQSEPPGELREESPEESAARGEESISEGDDGSEDSRAPSEPQSPVMPSPPAEIGRLEFVVGTEVIVNRGGRWPGKVTSVGGSGSATFLTKGRLQVCYEYSKRKGCGFTRTMETAWVEPHDLERRIVSPRKSPTRTEAATPVAAA